MLPVGNAMFGQRKPAAPTPASNVGSYLSSVVKKMSSGGVDASAAAGVWHKVQGSIGVVHVVLGIILSVWALWVMSGLNAQVDALVLGVLTALVGAVGVLGWHKDAASAKTLYLVAVCVVALLALSFRTRLTTSAENDCIMAETWTRMDHLEKAVLEVKHEDLLKGVLVRLDHMHDMIQEAEVGAADAAAHRQEQLKFKDMDREFIEEKLETLTSLAQRSYQHLDQRIAEISANMTSVQDGQETEETTQTQRVQQASKLKSLRALGNFVGRQQSQIADLQAVIAGHQANETISGPEFEKLLTKLGRHTSHDELLKEVQSEKENTGFVSAAIDRLGANKYDEISVGGFSDRQKERKARQELKRDEFETHVSRVLEGHNNRFESKNKFVKSLEVFLQELPENCLREMDELIPGLLMAWTIIAACAVGAHAALTSVVVSSKKDS